jgi:hypothetical protein
VNKATGVALRWPVAELVDLDTLTTLSFGPLSLSPELESLRRQLNRRIPALCGRMPASLRDSALLAIQARTTRFQARHVGAFFDKYAPPVWTVIPALAAGRRPVAPERLHDALTAQAAAMFLHLLDDHLVDGDIPVDNLFLQLRTEAWLQFRAALDDLAGAAPEVQAVTEELIDLYFRSVHRPPDRPDLATYEAVFRGEIATGLAAPLVTAGLAGYTEQEQQATRSMYEEFCVAWRILDDLRDCREDSLAGQVTSVYHLLSPEGRRAWGPSPTPETHDLLAEDLRAGGYARVAGAITAHLSVAARLADTLALSELADQYRTLALPLEDFA